MVNLIKRKEKKTLWFESASELYRPSDRRLSVKLVPAFLDRGCHMISVTDPYGRILGFLDRMVNLIMNGNYSQQLANKNILLS
jgi:hypothetical protein